MKRLPSEPKSAQVKNFFMGSSKGELHELRKALHDNSLEKKKDGMRNVIKRMTAGKDASALLPDVAESARTCSYVFTM